MKVYPQLLRNVRVADKKTARENPKVVAAVEGCKETGEVMGVFWYARVAQNH